MASALCPRTRLCNYVPVSLCARVTVRSVPKLFAEGYSPEPPNHGCLAIDGPGAFLLVVRQQAKSCHLLAVSTKTRCMFGVGQMMQSCHMLAVSQMTKTCCMFGVGQVRQSCHWLDVSQMMKNRRMFGVGQMTGRCRPVAVNRMVESCHRLAVSPRRRHSSLDRREYTRSEDYGHSLVERKAGVIELAQLFL